MKKNRLSLFLLLAAIGVGVFITVLMFVIQRHTIGTYHENLPYVSMGVHVKHKVTQGRLRFEELMGGADIDFKMVVMPTFDSTRSVLKTALKGGESEIGTLAIPEPELADKIQSSIARLDNFIVALEHGYSRKVDFDAKLASTPDSLRESLAQNFRIEKAALDKDIDKSYEILEATLANMIAWVDQDVQDDISRIEVFNVVSMTVMVLIFGGAAYAVYLIQSKNEKFADEAQNKFAQEVHRIEQMTTFVDAISNGRYDAVLTLDSENDNLANTLVDMRDKLSASAEADSKRNWSTQGLAEIGLILRSSSDSADQLYFNVTKFIVKYTNANQGGLFLLEDDDKDDTYLQLVSCYAYEKRKYLEKRVNIGEGLTGQCVLEGNTLYMTDVPQDYIRITSGLGDATPASLLIVPLKVNDRVYGVLELASFNTFSAYEIEFVERIAESVASTVSTVRTNERTKSLLEQTQQQTEQMRSQEEEMRQNMEELSATQEQMQRQVEEINKVQKASQEREEVFSLTTILSESDLYGSIILVNDKFCEVAKYRRDELIGKPHNVVRHPDMPKELFRVMWSTLKKGQVFQGILKNKAKDGSHYWVDATIVPIRDENGQVVKYTGARYHIKDEHLAEELYNRQAVKLGFPLLKETEPQAV